MKKLIITLLVSVFFISAFAQERTVTKTIKEGHTYYKYNGVAADTLVSTNQDTIDVVFTYQGEYVTKLAVKTKFDLRTLLDTTVAVSVYGKEFDDDATYVEVIPSSLTSDINADNTVNVITSDPYSVEAAYVMDADSTFASHNITPFDISYRIYRIRYIIQGASAYGTGVKIDEIEFKIYN